MLEHILVKETRRLLHACCLPLLSGGGWGHMIERLRENLLTAFELKDDVHQNLEVSE